MKKLFLLLLITIIPDGEYFVFNKKQTVLQWLF